MNKRQGGKGNHRRPAQGRRGGGGPRSGSNRGGDMRDGGSLGGSGGGRRKPLGGDQVEGRQAVRELLLAGTRRTREVVLAGDLDQADILDEIVQLANEDKVPIREIARGKFEAMARTEAPQGVLALAQPLFERELDDLLIARDGTPPFLIVLDGITDPGNLGAILRIAECAGVTGIVLPSHRTARISPSVTKSAAGAIEHLPIAQVPGIPSAIQRLKDSEVWTVALDMASDTDVFDLRVATDPVALVLGAEGRGVSRLVRERCDVVASIPLAGAIDSLNVSAAAAVACFEVVRRRKDAAS